MAQREPSAAEALFPHLPRGTPDVVQQRTPNVADAMWPSLSRSAKAAEAWREQRRQSLLRGLRELNAKMREGR